MLLSSADPYDIISHYELFNALLQRREERDTEWKEKTERRKIDQHLTSEQKTKKMRGRKKVNEETRALIFGQNFHL
jgi:hypothetical protein